MANPQKEDGHSVIANELLEAIILTHFNPIEHAIFWAIVRKTYGWNKKTDRISFTQLEVLTGKNKRHIAPALHGLIQRNIIIRFGEGQNLEYGVQKDYELWKPLPKTVTETVTESCNKPLPKTVTVDDTKPLPNPDKPLPIFDKTVTESCTKPLPNPVITKYNTKTITKEKQKKENFFVLPDWVPFEVWDAFLKMRIKIKHPLTDYGKHLAIKELEKFKQSGEDPVEILNRAILNSWRGLYSLKDNKPQPVIQKYLTPEEAMEQERARR